MADCFSLMDC